MSQAENPEAAPESLTAEVEGGAPGKILTPEAKRALAEAAARRLLQNETQAPAELGGPSGPEPTRYGDWERGGRAVDF